MSIDRLVNLGLILNSDDMQIDHMLVTLHNNLSIQKIIYTTVHLVMALLEVPQVWCLIN